MEANIDDTREIITEEPEIEVELEDEDRDYREAINRVNNSPLLKFKRDYPCRTKPCGTK